MSSFAQLLTNPGPAAIAVIRFGGPAADTFIARHIRSHAIPTPAARPIGRATLVEADESPLDDILLSRHPRPAATEWRIHLHGSPWIVNRCGELLALSGLPLLDGQPATPAWPAADRLDAEAHVALGGMLTLAGARWLLANTAHLRTALQQAIAAPDIRTGHAIVADLLSAPPVFDWFARPLRVALVGPPNAGKSTLANALTGRAVSLVSPQPGTTRDWVEARGEAAGFPVAWLDTAGLREAAEPLEAAGIEQSRSLIAAADALIVVLDARPAQRPAIASFIAAAAALAPAAVALNKIDDGCDPASIRAVLPPAWAACATATSATLATGLDQLCDTLIRGIGRSGPELARPGPVSPAQRLILQSAIQMQSHNLFTDKILQLLNSG